MTTETETKKPKRKRKLRRFIVTLDGVPCARITDKRFGYKLIPAGGTLIADADKKPDQFGGEKSANRAVLRAIRLRRKLAESCCDVPACYAPFVRDGNYMVVEVKPE
jgi:hypothetical protein